MADRYTYIPSIGIFWMVVWGVCELAAGWEYKVLVFALARRRPCCWRV